MPPSHLLRGGCTGPRVVTAEKIARFGPRPDYLAYDALNCEMFPTNRLAEATSFGYDEHRNRVTLVAPAREATCYGYGALDRLADRDVTAARALRQHVTLSEIAADVARATGVPAERLRERGRWGNDERAVAVYLSRRLTPRPLAHIGSCFGGVKGSAVAIIVRGIAHRRMKERRLNSLLSALEASVVKDQTSKT